MADKYIGQITGYFNPSSNIMNFIRGDGEKHSFEYVSKLGIQAPEGTIFKINNKEFEIGPSGILEFDDVKITSIISPKALGSDVIIDYEYR